jgi:hypothetical protein
MGLKVKPLKLKILLFIKRFEILFLRKSIPVFNKGLINTEHKH